MILSHPGEKSRLFFYRGLEPDRRARPRDGIANVQEFTPIPRGCARFVLIVFLYPGNPFFGILIHNTTETHPGERRMERKNGMDAMKKTHRTADAATPHQLIGMAYELAILACSREEAVRSQKAIGLLRNVMRSVGPADSSDLMGCYDWCLDRIGNGEFAMAAQTLSVLRQAWVDVERQFRQ
jgi:hypothetical protein